MCSDKLDYVGFNVELNGYTVCGFNTTCNKTIELTTEEIDISDGINVTYYRSIDYLQQDLPEEKDSGYMLKWNVKKPNGELYEIENEDFNSKNNEAFTSWMEIFYEITEVQKVKYEEMHC